MSSDIPKDGFNPYSKPVIERPYTKDMIEAKMGGAIDPNQPETSIPEPTYSQPKVEEEAFTSNWSKPSNTSNTSSKSNDFESQNFAGNPDLQDLSEKEKRKAAGKTADALLVAYGNYIPMLPTKLSSYNMAKMERLHMGNEIDLNMTVKADGTTIKRFMIETNYQVEDIFTVTKEMKDDIREPLIDVLMEKQLALTPMQRLMMAVGGHLVQVGVNCAQFVMSKKASMEQFKEFRAMQGNRSNIPPQPVAPAPSAASGEETVYAAPEVVEEETFSNDDYMNDNVKREEEVLSVENGGITQEYEVPNEQY